jgi:hypothetical protein
VAIPQQYGIERKWKYRFSESFDPEPLFVLLFLTRTMIRTLTALVFAAIFASATARAGEVALLLEEPYGDFGAFNPTGHAAIYLSDVCADTPTHLRRCEPGEAGVVLSRYHKVGGYDWLAMPLLPYLYAVERPEQIPAGADERLVLRLRDRYRRAHLMDLVPDDPKHEIPGGDWTQLVGEAYDRKIYGFAIATTSEQDDALIAQLNDSRNASHFNLFFRNCANFSSSILNFYYPHSIHRNFVSDVGLMTPKQAARALTRYDKRDPKIELHTFVIQQVPGTIKRSTPVDGVVESLVKSKKYVLPLAYLNPLVTGTLVVAYFGDGRFHADPNALVFDPSHDLSPVTIGQPPMSLAAAPASGSGSGSSGAAEGMISSMP